MGTEYPIHIKCQFCSGTGNRNSKVGEDEASQTCKSCGGAGFVEHALLAYPDGIVPSYLVFEALDTGEYNSLTAAKQRDAGVVLSAGFVDLRDGSKGITAMEGVFGSESQTIENLKELV